MGVDFNPNNNLNWPASDAIQKSQNAGSSQSSQVIQQLQEYYENLEQDINSGAPIDQIRDDVSAIQQFMQNPATGNALQTIMGGANSQQIMALRQNQVAWDKALSDFSSSPSPQTAQEFGSALNNFTQLLQQIAG